MKTYIVYYSCPCCPDPLACCGDPDQEANEMIEAENKTEARQMFQGMKMCRYQKITRIVEDRPGITDVSATIDGETKSYATLGSALDAIAEKLYNDLRKEA